MAYDELRESLVVFGGQTAIGDVADTWEWDGAAWLQRASAISPPARHGHRLVYDAARQRVLLFGGTGAGGLLGDTWQWNGATWQLVTPVTSPSARTGHALTYDAARQRVVLFGGTTGAGPVGDTWEWDGVDWVAVSTAGAPPARDGAAATYDPVRQRTVVFGGASGTTTFADTWEWNGSVWAQAFPPTTPAARSQAAMAYDAARQRVVMFGGAAAAVALAQTWEYDGIDWSPAAPTTNPPACRDQAMAYDAARLRVVMFGGNGNPAGSLVPAATWSAGPGVVGPLASTYGAGCGTPPLGLTPVASALPVPGETARATIDNTPSAIGAVSIGFSDQTFGAFPLPMSLAGVGMPGCDLLQSADALGWAVVSTTPTTADFALDLPAVASLLDVHFYLQAYFFAPGANPQQVVVSNGLDWRIGDPAQPITLVETFADSSRQDIAVSSSIWNAGARPGQIGNDGRHGSFDVTLGTSLGGGVYEWSTDNFTIPASHSLTGLSYVVTDGKFYFTDFVLPAGTTLRFTGSVAPQIWVRGTAQVAGTIDLSAPEMPFWIPGPGIVAAGQHVSNFNGIGPSTSYSVALPNFASGQPGGAGGIGGGRGGSGGDECRLNGDVTHLVGLTVVHDYYGQDGEDVRVPAGHAYAANAVGTGGKGSLLHPITGVTTNTPVVSGTWRVLFAPGGGGGGFSGPGGVAAITTAPAATSIDVAQAGGLAFALLPQPAGVASLDHFVVGGSGGGGGGSHSYGTQIGGTLAFPTVGPFVAGSGGTGGGGAMALRAGGDLTVANTALLVSQGGAGVLITGDNPNTPNGDYSWGVTSPGGGGSGGSFLLQSGGTLACAGNVDVAGGAGSRTGSVVLAGTFIAAFNIVSQAGNGAPGFYRLEAAAALPSFTGTGVPAFNPSQNGALLQDRDPYTGSASTWYASGAVAPTWLRYELDVDADGDGTIDVTYTDSGAPGTQKANDPNGPVTILFQGAELDTSGVPVPGTVSPWREGIGLGAGAGIQLDGVNGFRFQLLFHGASFPQAVVRGLRVFARE